MDKPKGWTKVYENRYRYDKAGYRGHAFIEQRGEKWRAYAVVKKDSDREFGDEEIKERYTRKFDSEQKARNAIQRKMKQISSKYTR